LIIIEQKPLDEILSHIVEGKHRNILIAGCDGCNQPPRGLREAKTLGLLLEMGSKLKNIDLKWNATTVVKQCDNRVVATSLRPLVEEVDAVLALSCGVGTQVVAEVFPELPVYPAQNTKFVGSEEREQGNAYEKCHACGDCILDKTAGICPIARCAKSLLNGPCGGSQDGKCEVGDGRDCAWQLIYDRLKAFGRLDSLDEIMPPKDWSTSSHGGVRQIVREDLVPAKSSKGKG
jgi:hypothetical protein